MITRLEATLATRKSPQFSLIFVGIKFSPLKWITNKHGVNPHFAFVKSSIYICSVHVRYSSLENKNFFLLCRFLRLSDPPSASSEKSCRHRKRIKLLEHIVIFLMRVADNTFEYQIAVLSKLELQSNLGNFCLILRLSALHLPPWKSCRQRKRIN